MTQETNPQDFIAISQVKARYCRFLDTKDWAAYTDLFTEDLELDVMPDSPPIRGREAAIKFIRSAIEHAITAHQVHLPDMQIDGDTAKVSWAMQDRVLWGADRAATATDGGHTGYGYYHERYVRKDGRWRIAVLQLRYLHMDTHPRS
jgi:ketosteroid isomerase-like protein